MSRKRLNPFEKEFLIRRFREASDLKLADFCQANGITAQSFRRWMEQYDAAGIEGLAKGRKYPDLLPHSTDPTVENYKKEILRLTIENERLKKLHSPNDPLHIDISFLRRFPPNAAGSVFLFPKNHLISSLFVVAILGTNVIKPAFIVN